MSESMKIRNLKNYGIPSHIVNILEKDYSPYLLPLQEDAVRNYGILDCGGNEERRMQYAPTEGSDKKGQLLIFRKTHTEFTKKTISKFIIALWETMRRLSKEKRPLDRLRILLHCIFGRINAIIRLLTVSSGNL